MNVEQRIRKRRRDAELAAAFGDIERDLDDLRSTLGRALADYESRLDDILDDLPAWLNFDRDEVEAFFTTELGEGPVRIGPRAAAVAAAAVESYLHAWVDPESANFPPDVDDSLGSEWAAQLEEADDRLA